MTIKKTVQFEISFEVNLGRKASWTLVFERESDCPHIVIGLRWGDKEVFTHEVEQSTDEVLKMLKELTDVGL